MGVCGRRGRRRRDGLEGEGWRNKGRIVVQTEEISRDSFSLEAAVSHLCQSEGGFVCSCTGSVWALNHAVPQLSSCKEQHERWLVLLKGGDVCI